MVCKSDHEGGGGQKTQNFDHVVYGWPFLYVSSTDCLDKPSTNNSFHLDYLHYWLEKVLITIEFFGRNVYNYLIDRLSVCFCGNQWFPIYLKRLSIEKETGILF